MVSLDRFIIEFDKGLRTLFASAPTQRSLPGKALPPPELSEAEKRLAVALMRVNHSGEICAQALYQDRALTARAVSDPWRYLRIAIPSRRFSEPANITLDVM